MHESSKNNRPMNLETKIFPLWLMAVLAVALVVILAGGVRFYHSVKSFTLHRAEYRFAAIAHLKVDQISAWRSERLSDAAVLTESPLITAAVARFFVDQNSVNAQELRSHFLSLQAHNHYSNILLVTPEGGVRLSLNEDTKNSQRLCCSSD